MKIDRSRFLLLTGALSAAAIAACSSSNTTVNNNPVSDGGTDATTMMTTTDSGSDAASSMPDSSSEGDDASTNGDSAACDDTVITGANACAAIADAGTTDAGSANFCLTSASCTQLFATVKPKLAAQIANCLAAISSPCDETVSSQRAEEECVTAALATACPDSTAPASCATACGDSGVDGGVATCAEVLPGLTDMGTGSYITCVSESGGSGCPDPSSGTDACLSSVTGL